MKVMYDSNNSGGSFWIGEDDIQKMEAAGWVHSGYMTWSLEADSVQSAKDQWAALLGKDPDEIGCECCGPPHNFGPAIEWDEEEDDVADDDA